MKNYKITDIVWDTDGDEEIADFLPKEMNVGFPESEVAGLDDDEISEKISNHISAETSFCHEGFNYIEIIPEVEKENEKSSPSPGL